MEQFFKSKQATQNFAEEDEQLTTYRDGLDTLSQF